MLLQHIFKGRLTPTPPQPVISKYSGQSGKSDSADSSTTLEWKWPEWTTDDLKNCAKGKHGSSRKVVVSGWVSYFTQTARAYCACGKKCWVWFRDGYTDPYTGEPGDHERWIDGHLRMEEMFAQQREREKARYL